MCSIWNFEFVYSILISGKDTSKLILEIKSPYLGKSNILLEPKLKFVLKLILE